MINRRLRENGRYVLNGLAIITLTSVGLALTGATSIRLEMVILLFILFFLQPLPLKIQTLFMLLPFKSAMVLDETISLLVLFQGVLLLSLIANKKSIHFKHVFILLAFYILQLISSLIYGGSIISITSLIVTFLLVILLCEYFMNNKEDVFPVYAKSLILGILSATLIAFIPEMDALMAGEGGRFTGLWTNPNRLGMQLLVAVALILSLFLEKRISIPIGILSLVVLGYFITLTESRSTIYALSLLMIVAITMRFKNEKITIPFYSYIKAVATIILFIIIAYASFSFVMKPIVNERGAVSEGEDFSNGRFTILEENLNWLVKEKDGVPLIIGLGIDNGLNYMRENHFYTAGTHNTYAEMFISTGVLGFLVWIGFLISVYGPSIKPVLLYRKLFVVILLFYTFTGHLHTSTFLYVTLTLMACSNVPKAITNE